MRSKTITSPDPRDKPCVICNHVKCQGDTDVMYHSNCMKKYISKLPCQKLIKMDKFGGRGKIPETFLPSDEIDLGLGRRIQLLNNVDCRFWLSIKISLLLTMDLAFHLLQQQRAYLIHPHISLLSVHSHQSSLTQ